MNADDKSKNERIYSAIATAAERFERMVADGTLQGAHKRDLALIVVGALEGAGFRIVRARTRVIFRADGSPVTVTVPKNQNEG